MAAGTLMAADTGGSSPPLIHAGLGWLRGWAGGDEWLRRLPTLVEECAGRWSLRLGEPFAYAYASLAMPATLPDGSGAVLKVQFPDRESEHEADALAVWNGDGAVRLLEHDRQRHALLLERCLPGTPLSQLGQDDALAVMIGLFPRLWKPVASPFRSLAGEAARWSRDLPQRWERTGRPFDARLLQAALDALETMPASSGEQVLVHQDLHAGNVLRAEREPWLVIDPKPLAGEPAFGIAALVRGPELGRGPDRLRHRLDRLAAELGLDRERARLWTLAHTLAWAFEGDRVLPAHVETARELLLSG
jgi:streptomycin 6-kinase